MHCRSESLSHLPVSHARAHFRCAGDVQYLRCWHIFLNQNSWSPKCLHYSTALVARLICCVIKMNPLTCVRQVWEQLRHYQNLTFLFPVDFCGEIFSRLSGPPQRAPGASPSAYNISSATGPERTNFPRGVPARNTFHIGQQRGARDQQGSPYNASPASPSLSHGTSQQRRPPTSGIFSKFTSKFVRRWEWVTGRWRSVLASSSGWLRHRGGMKGL